MRSLQWYKRGAAYKKALFAIETCGVFVQYEVGKIPHHLE